MAGFFTKTKITLCSLLAAFTFSTATIGCSTHYSWFDVGNPYQERSIKPDQKEESVYDILNIERNKNIISVEAQKSTTRIDLEYVTIRSYQQQQEHSWTSNEVAPVGVAFEIIGLSAIVIGVGLALAGGETSDVAGVGGIIAGAGLGSLVLGLPFLLVKSESSKQPTGKTQITEVGEPREESYVKSRQPYFTEPASEIRIGFYSECFSFNGQKNAYTATTDNEGKVSVKISPAYENFAFSKAGLNYTPRAKKIKETSGERGLYEAMQKAQTIKCEIQIGTSAHDGTNDEKAFEISGYLLPY